MIKRNIRREYWISLFILLGLMLFFASCNSVDDDSTSESDSESASQSSSVLRATESPSQGKESIDSDDSSDRQSGDEKVEGSENEQGNSAVPIVDSGGDSQDSPLIEVDSSTIETDSNGNVVGFTLDGNPFRGDPSAAVLIEEYSDYQCPYCARFFRETLPELEANQIADSEAVLVYYDFPLSNIHPQAAAASNAARCAGEEGAAAYWEMHDALFDNPDEWSNSNAEDVFLTYAENIGLELAPFNACLKEYRFESQIEIDLAKGQELGITGTPSFVMNGQLLVGAQPTYVFNAAISSLLEGGQLVVTGPDTPSNQPSPGAAPTPAVFSDSYAGALGDPDAPVTIVEFTDYQCPYCSRHSLQTLPMIVQEMVDSGRVYYILKDFPLDQLHPGARSAAAAARCAGDQESYWEMHDMIFANQPEWAAEDESIVEHFIDYAENLGLNESEFSNCLEGGKYDEAVEANAQEGRALGVSGTPHFFVDGYPLSGARPFEHFEAAVTLAEEGRLADAFVQQPTQPEPTPGPSDVPIDDAYAIGDPNAPITIVEYTDYQCPYCSRHFQTTYPQLLEEYVESGIVRYVYKDFPLMQIHPQALKAAEAARCAWDQDKFLEMHDMIFERQQEWSGKDPIDIFVNYARELALDEETFSQCLNSGEHESAVMADLQEGISLGVNGTPSFFINGYPVSGAQPFEMFQQAIQSLLAEQ